MINNRNLSVIGAMALAFSLGAIGTAHAAENPTSQKATVEIADARAIALKVRPGKITAEELEKEKGGSGLRYSFDIKSGATVYEVGIDAHTAKILENVAEGKNPD